MAKKVNYYSTDKLYKVKKRKTNINFIYLLVNLCSLIVLMLAIIFFCNSININTKDQTLSYVGTGNADYKIYLKDNNYYETPYLNSGMQYIASLIKTINVKYDYSMHSTKDLDYAYRYKINAEVRVTEKDDSGKVLFTKKYDLTKEKNLTVKNNNFVINEDIDIDYNKYNKIASSFTSDYTLVADSNLILSLEVYTVGKDSSLDKQLEQTDNINVKIPLLEQTMKIDIEKVENNGNITYNDGLFVVKHKLLFIASILLGIISLIGALVSMVILYMRYGEQNIYKIKVKKLLKNYDRLIVNGKTEIDESKYANKIYPETFEEMVDAAQTYSVPIHYYEVIPNEKCFFIIIKDDTLYKYRLTRAFLEKNPTNKVEKETTTSKKPKVNSHK